jgi:phosphate transport system protein
MPVVHGYVHSTVIRGHYQEELRSLEQAVLDELDVVVRQLTLVLEALPRADRSVAEEVVRRDEEVDRRYAALQTDLVAVIARQAPVAGDLRLVTALLHISRMVERIGDQCVNVAKLATLAGPPPAGTEELADCVLSMGRQTLEAVRGAGVALRERDVGLADTLSERDQDVNELNRTCFTRAIELGSDESARAWATAMILVARAFERVGDNAVDIGAHLRFAATGAFEARPAATEVAG